MIQEASLPYPDRPPRELLRAAAIARGVDFDDARLDQLSEQAKGLLQQEEKDRYSSAGLEIAPAPYPHTVDEEVVMNFYPLVDGKKMTGPRREEISRIGTEGIQALQNYALLVDAGFLSQPKTVRSAANISMERILTKRLGFAPTGEGQGIVVADYEAMAHKAFSPEIQKAEARLAERQARLAPNVGELATKPKAGQFAEAYPMPENQLTAEFDLLDSYRADFPDSAPLVNEALNELKRYVGIHIQKFAREALIDPADDMFDKPEKLTNDLDRIGIDPQASSIPTLGRAMLNLRMPLTGAEIAKGMNGDREEQNRTKIIEDGITVVGEMPAEGQALIDGIYGLVGATVKQETQLYPTAPIERKRVIRQGEYQGVPVFFEEIHTFGDPDLGGESTFKVMMISPVTARMTLDGSI